MDGENNGLNPIKMDDLGEKTHDFWKHPYLPTIDFHRRAVGFKVLFLPYSSGQTIIFHQPNI